MRALRALGELLLGQEDSSAFASLLAALLWTVATLLADGLTMIGTAAIATGSYLMYYRQRLRLERVNALRKYN